jgi:hypothetical protein
MSELSAIAPAFVDMAHRTVCATVATVDTQGRPRSRIVHPYWVAPGAVEAAGPTRLDHARPGGDLLTWADGGA